MTTNRDEESPFYWKSETLSAEWFASVFNGLDVVSGELVDSTAATTEYRTDLRFAVGPIHL